MPEVSWNYQEWNDLHIWSLDGDEWSDMAAHCGQPYARWKATLIEEFLTPYLGESQDVLEVAPGHGRWAAEMIGRTRSLTLVDLSEACIDACRERFSDRSEVSYMVTDGLSLPGVPDGSIDFAWSFDSFVHMEFDVIDSYLAEFNRVLRPGGRFVIHHAGMREWSRRWVPLTRRFGLPGRVAQSLMSQGRLRDNGNRSNVSRVAVADAIVRHGMTVESQRQAWGSNGQFDVTKYSDWITIGSAGG